MTDYERGFVKKASDLGYDGLALLKFAGDLLVSRKLDRDERKSLLSSLPESRKGQILKFLLDESSGNSGKRYVVTARDHDKSRGEYTYLPEEDRLFETETQKERNARKRKMRGWSRLFWLGF